MRLSERVHLVGSGALGFDLSEAHDCHIYLVDCGNELALVDVGSGLGAELFLANVGRQGFDPARIKHVLLTHGHGDHGGGAARIRELLSDVVMYASPLVAAALAAGDEQALSIDVARDAGIYGRDYVLRACAVDVEVNDGESIAVGELQFQVLETPGHCDGHLSFLVETGGQRTLFSGDVVFFGGRILLQALHDCRLDAQIASLRRLRDLNVDVLLPGHLAVSLSGGQRHIEQANEVLDRLLIPEQLVTAW